ncbi:NlpC/P60 family protein [Nocardia sp. CA-107356]|uniref:bifunctional WXG100 family type VII secretion target/C40 family peptidase n=1 Tax=Nocardia sp. CA-107356 TaxID=3239972 RepID=UPI003D8CC93B
MAKPIVDLHNSFGTGALPADGPTAALRNASTAINTVYEDGRNSINQVGSTWTGQGGLAARDTAMMLQASAATIADRGNNVADVVGRAAADVQIGQQKVNAILQSFVSNVQAAGPAAVTPAGLRMIVNSAIDHAGQALKVVGGVRSELEAHIASMGGLIPPPANPAPGIDEELTIWLPDGSTAQAPNKTAADAVREAIRRRGIPYAWGGNSPESGFDCSGFTKWAYHDAGLELPRVAADQFNVGTRVDRANVQPGDLACWTGHVAMYIGNGKIIEAGNPVAISGIRTENKGMTFLGFCRPTG